MRRSSWVTCLNGENGPRGMPSHEALLVSPQGALEILVMKGADLHPNDHSIKHFTDASNEGWGAHLEQAFTKGLWSNREERLYT